METIMRLHPSILLALLGLASSGCVYTIPTSTVYGRCHSISVTAASPSAAERATRLRFFIGPTRPSRMQPPKRPRTVRTNAGGCPSSWHHVFVTDGPPAATSPLAVTPVVGVQVDGVVRNEVGNTHGHRTPLHLHCQDGSGDLSQCPL